MVPIAFRPVSYTHLTELQNIRTFKQAQYLMPIPMTETNKVPHIVQNPGY